MSSYTNSLAHKGYCCRRWIFSRISALGRTEPFFFLFFFFFWLNGKITHGVVTFTMDDFARERAFRKQKRNFGQNASSVIASINSTTYVQRASGSKMRVPGLSWDWSQDVGGGEGLLWVMQVQFACNSIFLYTWKRKNDQGRSWKHIAATKEHICLEGYHGFDKKKFFLLKKPRLNIHRRRGNLKKIRKRNRKKSRWSFLLNHIIINRVLLLSGKRRPGPWREGCGELPKACLSQ